MKRMETSPGSPEQSREAQKSEVLGSIFRVKGRANSEIHNLSNPAALSDIQPINDRTRSYSPIPDTLPPTVRAAIQRERDADTAKRNAEIQEDRKRFRKESSQQEREKNKQVARNQSEIDRAIAIRDEAAKWERYLVGQEDIENAYLTKREALDATKQKALQALGDNNLPTTNKPLIDHSGPYTKPTGYTLRSELQDEYKQQQEELTEWVKVNLPRKLWAEYGIPSSDIASEGPLIAAHTAPGNLAEQFLRLEDDLASVAKQERERIQDDWQRKRDTEATPAKVLDEMRGTEQETQTQRERADQAEAKAAQLREQLERTQKELEAAKLLQQQEHDERVALQQQLEEAKRALEDQRIAAEAEKVAAVAQAKDEIIADFAEDQGLLRERDLNNPLTAENLDRLISRGWLDWERLTPAEKRLLTNANNDPNSEVYGMGYQMNTRERLQVARDDIANSLRDITSRFTHFIDDRAELFGAAAGLVAGAGLRAFLVHEGYDVQAADLFARTVALPLGALRLAAMPLAERIPFISQREQEHPTATRRIRGLANAVTTGVLGWAGESFTGQSPTHIETQSSTSTSQRQENLMPSATDSATAGNPTVTAENPSTFHWPDQLRIDGSIWETIQSNISGKLTGTYQLSEFGQNYLTDALKDVVSNQFANPGVVHSGDMINLSADVKHQVGKHLLRALQQNMDNGSFIQSGGTGTDFNNLRQFGEFLSNAK